MNKVGSFGKVGNRFSENDAEFLTRVKERISEKGYRPDLHLKTSGVADEKQYIVIGFHPNVGRPSESEIRAFVETQFPGMKIDWRSMKNAKDNVQVGLLSNAEKILVEDFSKIPPAFKPMGTGMYKDASTGAIWNLDKEGDGLVLTRQHEEVPPEDLKVLEDIDVGDEVLTPLGKGEVVDKGASKITVKFAQGLTRDLPPRDIMKHYDQNKERQWLQQYYAVAFGDPGFAADLVKTYGS